MGNASLPHGVSSPAPPLRCGEDGGGGAFPHGASILYQSIRDRQTYSRAEDGTPTKRRVSKRQVSKRLVSKRLKRQVYKTSGLQNVRLQNVQFQNVNQH